MRKAFTNLLSLIDVGVIIMYRGVYFLILAPSNYVARRKAAR